MRCFWGDRKSVRRQQSPRDRILNLYRRWRSRRNNLISRETSTEDFPSWSSKGLPQRFSNRGDASSAADVNSCERQNGGSGLLQSFGLAQNGDYRIDPVIRSVRVGLGWDNDANLDLSVIMFDDHMQVTDTVWSKKRQSTCGSIVQAEDNLTGVRQDNEVISVNLTEIPLHVHHIVYTVLFPDCNNTSDQVSSAHMRIMHREGANDDHEMCYYALTNTLGPAMMMGALSRNDLHWSFRTLGCPATGCTIFELLKNTENLDCLKERLSFIGKRTKATIDAVRAIGLSLKQSCSLLERKITSSPYYVMTFGNRQFTSSPVSGSSWPVWDNDSFEIKWSAAAEKERLLVEVFDHDVNGPDGFMGMIDIPVTELFLLDTGRYERAFRLGASKSEKRKDQRVSGELRLSFQTT